MRSPPGSLATKPPPTPMAKLQDDIQEIDILLEASKRARESQLALLLEDPSLASSPGDRQCCASARGEVFYGVFFLLSEGV